MRKLNKNFKDQKRTVQAMQGACKGWTGSCSCTRVDCSCSPTDVQQRNKVSDKQYGYYFDSFSGSAF